MPCTWISCEEHMCVSDRRISSKKQTPEVCITRYSHPDMRNIIWHCWLNYIQQTDTWGMHHWIFTSWHEEHHMTLTFRIMTLYVSGIRMIWRCMWVLLEWCDVVCEWHQNDMTLYVSTMVLTYSTHSDAYAWQMWWHMVHMIYMVIYGSLSMRCTNMCFDLRYVCYIMHT